MNPDQLPPDTINFPFPAPPRRSRLLLLLVLVLLALAGCRGQGEFRTRPRDTTPVGDFLGLPVPVTLEELAANPLAFRGQYVRVTGLFTPPEEFGVCLRNVRGPAGRWYLANEDWRLAVNGYNTVAPRLQPGTPMTIDGIFTYYAGPLGCGKGASPDSVWYLAALHIESPNPLPLLARNGAGGGDLVYFNGTVPEAGGTITATSAMTATAGTPLPTTDPAGTITPTGSPTATPTAPAGATTVTPTNTPSPTATPAPGTTIPPVTSPTPTMTPSPTPTGAEEGPTPTPVPPTPGSPPGGDYPPPPPTPTAAYP